MPPDFPIHPVPTRPFPHPPTQPDRTIHAAPTSVAAFVGWTPIGPLDACVSIASLSEFLNLYGPLDSRSLVAFSVSQFFENGGEQARMVRIANSDGTVLSPSDDPAVPGPFEAALFPSTPGAGIPLLSAVDFNLLCVPGECVPGTLALLDAFCEARRAFLLIDAAPVSVSGPPLSSANSAFYLPWLTTPDPFQPGSTLSSPPCGFIAGAIARVDSQRGVWHAPAGMDAVLTGASATAFGLDDAQVAALGSLGINCIRTLASEGIVPWGARTTIGTQTGAGEWTYIPVRRFALFVEQSIRQSTAWTVFEPNDAALWAALTLSITAFLQELFVQGAFPGGNPGQAYFVRCDSETTTQQDIALGRLNIDVGLAPLTPAEFIVLQIALGAAIPGHG